MDDNEKLIEEALRPMTDRDVTQNPAATRAFIRQLGDALKAADKALTPTDDEREALAQVIFDRSHTPEDALNLWDGDISKLADAILAAGFRLSEVPEPSVEDQGPAASCHLCVGAGGYEDHDGLWVECSCQRAEPQVEPSDALRDAIDHIQGAVEFQDAINPEAVRVVIDAALRAAHDRYMSALRSGRGVVGQEGEQR